MADNLTSDIPELMTRAERSLSAARLLIDNGYFTEAASRAYYAAFYAATALLHSEGITLSKHAAVIAKVGQLFAKTGRLESYLHRLLIDMFDERQVADYSGTGFSADRAETAHQNATVFVAAVNEYFDKQEHN